MKKLMVLFCALTLITLSCAHAQGNYTAYAGATPLVSISYDDSKYTLDTTSYMGSSRGNHKWLGMFYSGSYTIDCAADNYGNISVSELSTRLTDALSADNAQLLETYQGGAFSFLIYSLNGVNGQSYYAATMVESYAVHFEIYNMRGGVDSGALDALKSFLKGVTR